MPGNIVIKYKPLETTPAQIIHQIYEAFLDKDNREGATAWACEVVWKQAFGYAEVTRLAVEHGVRLEPIKTPKPKFKVGDIVMSRYFPPFVVDAVEGGKYHVIPFPFGENIGDRADEDICGRIVYTISSVDNDATLDLNKVSNIYDIHAKFLRSAIIPKNKPRKRTSK